MVNPKIRTGFLGWNSILMAIQMGIQPINAETTGIMIIINQFINPFFTELYLRNRVFPLPDSGH
jgi:hypothetical protein